MDSKAQFKQENISAPMELFTMPQYTLPSDSECSTSSDWSFSESSAYNSPACSPVLPSVPLARSIRGTEQPRQDSLSGNGQFTSPEPQFPTSYTHYRAPVKLPRLLADPSSTHEHVRRPVNAFLLFRSDFLKRRVIPPQVERRQQNLSRIAGECWNLLPEEERSKWQAQAAEKLAIHQKMHPTYKYTPSPKGTGRTKGKSRQGGQHNEDEKKRNRDLREIYAQMPGPARSPVRPKNTRTYRRRSGEKEKGEKKDRASREATVTPLPPSSSPSPSPPSRESVLDNEPSLPPFFPQHSYPHYVTQRRPSTSLGFTTQQNFHDDHASSRSGLSLTRPSSAASSETGLSLSNLVRNLDITPTAANFHNISMPVPSASINWQPTLTSEVYTTCVRGAAFPVNAESANLPTAAPDQADEQLQDGATNTLLGSLYPDELHPFTISSFGDSKPFSFFEDYPGSSMDGWDFRSLFSEPLETQAFDSTFQSPQ